MEETMIVKYLKGELKGQEKKDFIRSVRTNETLRNEYFKYKDIWDYSAMKLDAYPYDENKEWTGISKRISSKSNTSVLFKKRWYHIAGIAALLVVAFLLGKLNLIHQNSDVDLGLGHVIEIPTGKISKITLADGSSVVLNAGSKLLVPLDFGKTERRLELQGEGFFEVTRNEKKSFIVKSGKQAVKVLGTKFNIRAYPDETVFETTLLEGVVEWTNHQNKYILQPGDELLYHVLAGTVEQQSVNGQKAKSWTQGKYDFQDAGIMKIASVLEKYYGVDVIYDEQAFRNKHYNGAINMDESLEHTMSILGLMMEIKYEIKNEQVTITKID
jgi:ferric-dicitrate binding protein FerR (iron transport regulator)